MAYCKEVGDIGEKAVAQFLEEQGALILEQNFRCPYGEIDIVARDGEEIVFVEVKTRTSSKFGEPEEAVNYHKQRRLRLIAYHYLINEAHAYLPCRFDVAAVHLGQDSKPEIRILRNCF